MDKYQPILNLMETEIAIKYVKDNFEKNLSKALNLTRVSAPLFVLPESGLNDNLNGYERAVRFDIKSISLDAEIVQSLAKWKRMALKKYAFTIGSGLYTDMNAIRRDEDLDNIHSCYVDQWDWEKIITDHNRTYSYLKKTVTKIYNVFLKVATLMTKKYPQLTYDLPDQITFISSSELEELYPNLSGHEREKEITKMNKAIFIYQIGWPLKNGKPHDGRAADYDDWNLNGDILLWYEPLQIAMELSSMGIRVNSQSLLLQLKYKNEEHKLSNPYCNDLMKNELPLTIGGGIGQSRLCMYYLKKLHIGEVQSSIWPDEMTSSLEKKNIHLL